MISPDIPLKKKKSTYNNNNNKFFYRRTLKFFCTSKNVRLNTIIDEINGRNFLNSVYYRYSPGPSTYYEV